MLEGLLYAMIVGVFVCLIAEINEEEGLDDNQKTNQTKV
jgi:hypothetical protein